MNPFQRLRDAVRSRRVSRASSVTQEFANHLFVNPLCSDYENVFAQVRPYINEMSLVQPYGVGRNGARLPIQRTPELLMLQNPNELQGWIDFAQSMFATWLTEDELNIHVHFGRGNKVIGYTILPAGSKCYNSAGEPYWQIQTAEGFETVERDEVMQILFSRSPKNLYKGISPATSVRAWAQTEDVLAQYERAYIENGAIPASITFIRASSQDKFNAARAELERNLSGAKNKNKTIYVWRQYDNATGEEQDQIEVKTIQGNNSTLAINDLANIINDHLNKAYGVSNFILGDDSSAKYDNAELSRYQFLSARIYPALLAFWNQFQHELDRITGGVGYGINFDLELPELTDRAKTKAETAQKNADNLIKLIQNGSAPKAAVDALELSKKWLNVAQGIYGRTLADVTSENKNDHKKPDGSHLADCGHHHNVDCSYYLHKTQTKIPDTASVTTTDALPPMTEAEKAIYATLVEMARKIMEEDNSLDETEVIAKINEVLEAEALAGEEKGAAALELLTNGDVKAEIQQVIKEGLAVSEALKERINARTEELVGNYGEETRRLLEEALKDSEGKSAAEIRKMLQDIMPRWQAERIARNETVYAFKSGRLEQDKLLAEKYGLHISLVWQTSHDPSVCDICAAMDGEKTPLGEAFVDSKETADGIVAWEHSRWNDGGQIPDAHVNCRCYFDEIVEEL